MNPVIYDNKKIAEVLAEKNWKLLTGKSAGRVGGNVVERYIDHQVNDFSHASWKLMEAFVAKWTSAKNYSNDSSAASNTVIDPVVEDSASIEAGTYYRGPLSRVRIQGDRNSASVWRIVQVLFKGAADTETEYTSDDGCQYAVYRKYYIEQASLPAMPAKASGVECSRNFQQDPISGLYSGYTERKVRLYQSVPEFYSMQDAFSKVQRTKHLGIREDGKDENGITIVLPDPTAQSAGVIVQLDKSKNTDCTHDVDVQTRTAIGKTGAATSETRGKFQTIAATDATNQANAEAVPARSDGVIKTVRNKFNEFSLYDTGVETRTAIEVTDAQRSVEHGKFEKREVAVDRNAAEPTLPTTQASAGVIKTVKDEVNEFGKHDVQEEVRTSVPVPAAQEEKTFTPFESRVVTVDRNTVADPTLPTAQDVGTIKVMRDELNEFDVHDVHTDLRTAIAVPSASVSDTREKFQTVATVRARNAAAALTPAAQSAGTIVTAKSELNDFAKYDTDLETRTALSVTDASKSIAHTAFETREEAVDRNVAAPTPPASQVAGTIVEQQDTINEFDKHDVRETTRTAVPQASAGSSDTRTTFETVAVAEARNADWAVTPVDQVAGTIKTVKDSLNEFQKHDTVVETRTAIGVEDVVQEKVITPFEVRTVNRDVHQANDAVALPTSQTQNHLVTVGLTKDEFGKSTVEVTERTGIVADSGSGDSKEFLSHTTVAEKRNQTTAITPSAFAAGTIERVDNKLNDLASYDTVRATEVADAKEQAAFIANLDEFTKTTVTRKWNQAVNTVPDATLGQNVDASINRFGLADYTLSAEVPITGLIGAAAIQWVTYGAISYVDTYSTEVKTVAIAPLGYPMKKYRYISGSQKVQDVHTYSLTFHATMAAAIAAIHEHGRESTYSRVRPGLWQAIAEDTTVIGLGTAASYDDPYADCPPIA